MDSQPFQIPATKHNRFSSLPVYLPSNPSPANAYSLWGMPRLFLVDPSSPSPSSSPSPVNVSPVRNSAHRHANSLNQANWSILHKNEDKEFGNLTSTVLVGMGLDAEKRNSKKAIKEDQEMQFTPNSDDLRLFTLNRAIATEEDDLEYGNQTSFDSLSAMSEDSSPFSPRQNEYTFDVNGEEICQHFLKGKCRFRERCRNSHNIPNCIYCSEELPVNRVAASAHLHHCWRLSQKQQ
jgi:hypothetical protein